MPIFYACRARTADKLAADAFYNIKPPAAFGKHVGRGTADVHEQKVVSLRFVQGKSQAEVGKILGVSQMFVSRAERKIVEK